MGLSLALGTALSLSGRRNSSPYDSNTDALFAAMTVKPNTTRKGHYDTLIRALKTSGVWDRLDALWVMAAHDEQAGRVNLKQPGSYTLTPVAAPTFTADRGFTGDGAASYLDTGFNPSTTGLVSQTNAHLGIWSRTPGQSLANSDIGNGNNFSLVLRTTADQINPRINQSVGTNLFANTDGSGHFIGTRNSGSTVQAYRQGVLIGDGVGLGSLASLANANLFILRRNSAGVYSERQLSAAHVGPSLTQGQATALYNALQAYMTAVGA